MTGGRTTESRFAWRAGRHLEALDPGYFGLDERGPAEMLDRARLYADLLTYFDANNRPYRPPEGGGKGPWAAFFDEDVSFLLAAISVLDVETEFRAFEMSDHDIVPDIHRSITRILDWTERAARLAALAPDTSVEAALSATMQQIIKSELRASLPERLYNRMAERGGNLPSEWLGPGVDYPDHVVFSTLNRVTGQLVMVARQYLKRSLEEKADHAPHTTLYLAFTEMFRESQADINQLTERHLDFFYRDVLRLKHAPAEPDRAHVAFTLSAPGQHVTLDKGTALLAGGDADPTPAIFRTDDALEVTDTVVTGFRALRVMRDHGRSDQEGVTHVTGVAAYPQANTADGFGQAFDRPGEGWRPFGATTSVHPDVLPRQAHAEIGFALTSRVLAMAEGTRRVQVELTLRKPLGHHIRDPIARYRRLLEAALGHAVSDPAFARYLSEAFIVEISTATGFHRIAKPEVYQPDMADKTVSNVAVTAMMPDSLRLDFTLADTDPAVAAFGQTGFPVEAPMLRMLFNPSARVYALSAFRDAKLESAAISVHVTGLRGLDMETDAGPVNAKKPFAPFGPMPRPRATLSIGSAELQAKRLDWMRVRVGWTDLPTPPEDFASHYAEYGRKTQNNSFQVRFRAGRGNDWTLLSEFDANKQWPEQSFSLFSEMRNGEGIARRSDWTLATSALPALETPPEENRTDGLFTMELMAPDYGFGQRIYPDLVATTAIENAGKAAKLFSGLFGGKPAPLPNPPLLPLVRSLTVDYAATVQRDISAATGEIDFFQMMPFEGAVVPRDARLVPIDTDRDGMLQIGLTGTRPPEVVSLLFDVTDTTASQWRASDGYLRPELSWAYRTATGWRPIPEEALIEDQTAGLTTHGIVRMSLPLDIARQPDGQVWLGLVAVGDVNRYGRILGVYAQAVSATRVLDASSNGTAPVLPAAAITRLQTAHMGIKTVTQPFASQGGRAAEATDAFRVRVSERLRHKNRAWQLADYQSMVLQAFPEIGDVACRRVRGGSLDVVVAGCRRADRPGHVPVVPLHVRFQISTWLRQHTSTAVKAVIVRNPNYEDLRVQARIVPSRDTSADVIARVEDAVDRMIAPWLFDPSLPMPIGQDSIDLAEVTSRIEAMDEVAHVMGLSLMQRHLVRDGSSASARFCLKDTARIGRDAARPLHADQAVSAHAILKSASPASVFVPARRHLVTYLGERDGLGTLHVDQDLIAADPARIADYQDDSRLIPSRPLRAGIGNLEIGRDLVVMDACDAAPPDSHLDTPRHRLDRIFMAT